MKIAALTTVLLALGSGASCASPPPPARPPEPLPALGPSGPPVVPAARKPAAPADPCPALGPDEISDEETPSIAGTTGRTSAGPWLESRGVTKAAFRSWVRSRDPRNLEDFDADSLFDNEDSCGKLTVGDKAEDALVCTLAVRTSVMRYSATVFVVRNKRITSVLDVGYALPAMDWPDTRWLDLQLVIAKGGLEATLRDRGKPGTILVAPPSYCHEHFARYLACEAAHRDGTPLEPVCPQVMESGKISYGHHPPTPGEDMMGGSHVEMHGCAEALPALDDLVKQTGAKDPYAAEFRADRAFAIASCKARGRYEWKDGRFVRTSGP